MNTADIILFSTFVTASAAVVFCCGHTVISIGRKFFDKGHEVVMPEPSFDILEEEPQVKLDADKALDVEAALSSAPTPGLDIEALEPVVPYSVRLYPTKGQEAATSASDADNEAEEIPVSHINIIEPIPKMAELDNKPESNSKNSFHKPRSKPPMLHSFRAHHKHKKSKDARVEHKLGVEEAIKHYDMFDVRP